MSTHLPDETRSEPNVDEMIVDFVRSARKSTYTTVAGKPSNYFMDLDDYLMGRIDDNLFEAATATRRRQWLAEHTAREIVDHSARLSVARLAFIEKPDAGPVGLLAMTNTLLRLTGMEGCILRPRKRLFLATVKGRPVQRGERFMIVSDVATTGSTISLVAGRLRRLGGIPVAAYVVYDRDEGARQLLEKEGIALLPFIDPRRQAEAQASVDRLP